MARKPDNKTETLIETTYSESLQVDKEAGVIRGVKVLGKQSRNAGGYEYSPAAMAKAAELYEGIGVNIDHPDRKTPGAERSLSQRFGELRGISIKESGVFGDLHYIKSHPLASSIVEAAERFPRQLGMSHNADGVKARRGGKMFVESIERVRSVDLVGQPATNNGLFESFKEESTVKKTVKQILEAAFGDKLKGSRLLEEDMAGPMAAEMEAPEASGSTEDQIKAAFRQAVMATFDDDKLDSKATLAKIKEILAAYDKLTAAPEKKPEGGDSKPTPESKVQTPSTDPNVKALMETVGELKRERDAAVAKDACRSLLESADRDSSDLRLKALMALSEEADRKALIESWPKRAKGSTPAKPQRSSTILESGQPGTYKRQEAKDFAASYR